MSKGRTSTTRPRLPVTLARGTLARFVAIMGLLRGFFFGFDAPNPHRSSSRTGRTWRFVKVLQVLVVAMRVIVGLTAVQITGVPHVIADVVTAMQGHEDRSHDDCPNDDGGRECPPGCPSCHCTHVMNALPSVAPPTMIDPLIPNDAVVAPYIALEPPGPELAAVYRPPREVV